MRNSILLVLTTILMAILPTEPVAAAESVEVWKQKRIAITNGSWSGNPFDVELDAEFVHEASGQTLRQFGFYDGNDTWRIHFMPTRSGTWTYQTSSQDPELDGHSGSFEATSSNLWGQLDGDNRRWKYRNGPYVAPMLLSVAEWFRRNPTTGCGDSSGTCPGALIDWAANVANATALGQTLVYVKHPQNSSAFVKSSDGDEFYLPVWRNLEGHFDRLRDRNMGHYIMFFSDDANEPDELGIKSGSGGTLSTREKRLFRYAIARFGAYPVVFWDTGIDISEYRSNTWINNFTKWFKANDPWQHPVSSRNGGGSGGIHPSDASYFSDGAKFGVTFQQTASRWNGTDVPVLYTDRWREGTPSNDCGRGATTADVRKAVWETVLVGGTGVYFADCGAEQFDYLHHSFASTFVIGSQLGVMQDFLRSRVADFAALTPDSKLVTSGQVDAVAGRSGQEIVAYTTSSQAFSLKLGTGTFQATWLNPVNGKIVQTTTVQGGSSVSFDPPGSSADWVLHVLSADSVPRPPVLEEPQ